MTLFTPGLDIISPYYLQDHYTNIKIAQEKAIEEEAKKKAEKEARKVSHTIVPSIFFASINWIDNVCNTIIPSLQEAKRKEKEAAKKEAKEKAKRDKEAGLTL